MKKRLLKTTLLIFMICGLMFSMISGSASDLMRGNLPQSIINNFGKDTATTRNFTWQTTTVFKKGFLQYCKRDEFFGFFRNNIIKVTAKSRVTKTDLDKRVVHKVWLKNLTPGTEYIYRIGNGKGGYSEAGLFKTAEIDDEEFTFINLTDTQGHYRSSYEYWKKTLDQALERFPDSEFVLHTGDIVEKGYRVQQWDFFSTAAREKLMNIPIVPVVGNHDVMDKDGTNPNAKNFVERFNTERIIGTGTPAGTVYSIDYGNAHIAVMNTQFGSNDLRKQAKWLREDMAKTTKPWKIVAMHRPVYGAGNNGTDLRNAWVPVFDELKIDLVIQGHDHNFVRSYPMKNNIRAADGEGTVYVVCNPAGLNLTAATERPWQILNLQPYTQMYLAVTVKSDILTVKAYDVQDNMVTAFSLKK